MKAYLLIASEESQVTKERYQEFLESYKKAKKHLQEFNNSYNYLTKRLKKAYSYCLSSDYSHEMGKSSYPLNSDEVLFLAQQAFSSYEIALIQMNDFLFSPGPINGSDQLSFIRNGLKAELEERYLDAYRFYNAADLKVIKDRGCYCLNLLKKDALYHYLKGIKLFNKEQYGDAHFDLMVAADEGHTKAKVKYGLMNIKGLGCSISIEEGLKYLEGTKTDLSGNKVGYDTEAVKLILSLYEDGTLLGYVAPEELKDILKGIEPEGKAFAKKALKKGFDERKAEDILIERASKGDLLSMERLYQEDSLSVDARGFYMEEASQHGDGYATYLLGVNSPKEEDEISLLEKSGSQGYFASYEKLTEIFEKKNDSDKVYEYALKGAEIGSVSLTYKLATIEEKKGLNKEAVKHYSMSADKGILPAFYRLYQIYKNGELGEEKDEKKANKVLFKSGFGHE